MTNWHYKRLDHLGMIAQRMTANTALPAAARAIFSDARHLAETLKHDAECVRRKSCLSRVFDRLCQGCRKAELHPCQESEASLQFCPLVREHSI